MASTLQPDRPAQRVRRMLGRIRRSDAISAAANFVGVQHRRVHQRLNTRFVRGVHLHTETYLGSPAVSARGEFVSLSERVQPAFRVAAPTYVPGPPAESVGGPIVVNSRRLGLASLNQPWVVGLSGGIVGQDQKLLWDLSYEWPGQPYLHTAYDLIELDPVPLPGLSTTLASMGGGENYFHFLLNCVARLSYLNKTYSPLDFDHYIVTGPVTNFMAESLSLFGIPQDRLRGTDPSITYRPERLIAPPLIHHPFVIPASAGEFVRSQVFARLPARRSRKRRIMIDRSDAATRRILNMDELDSVLTSFGIERVRLSGLSLAAQAQLFRDAEWVIANHGAALANLVFCEPGTRVLQLLAPGMMEREYRTLSQHSQLRHDYVIADFASTKDARLPLKQRDLVLSPSLLRQILHAETGS